jgi:hypothetical protein
MNNERFPEPREKIYPEGDASQLSPETRDMIKNPPKMDDVLRSQSPDERRGNQALVPEMLDEPTDEMIGFTKE